MPIGGAPVQVSDFGADISGFKLSPTGDRVMVWADRDLRCPDLACAGASRPSRRPARPHLRPAVRSPLGHLGGAGRAARASSASRSPTASWPAAACRLTGAWSATRRPSRSAAARRSLSRPTAAPSISRCAKRAASSRRRPTSTSSPAPARRLGAPVNLTDANDGTDNLPTVSPDGRTLAYFAMARADLRGRPPGVAAARSRHRPTRALTAGWDRSVGSIAWAPRRPSLLVTAERHARRAGVPRRRRDAARSRA